MSTLKFNDAETYLLSTGQKIGLLVRRSNNPKCDRCWHYREDVGQHADHETICGRCVSNIEGPGETRRWF